MNDDNLIPFDERTKSEQREIAKKGGRRSGEARRRRRAMKDMLNTILLSAPTCIPEELQPAAERMNLDTNDMLYAASLFNRALTDIQAAKYMDELLGRNPTLELKREDTRLNRARFTLDKQKALGRVEFDDIFKPDDLITG